MVGRSEPGRVRHRCIPRGPLGRARFDLGRVAQRITFFFPGDRRIAPLTVFRKQRSNERTEVARARTAMGRCIEQSHTADE